MKPQNHATREVVNLDGLFAFKMDTGRAGLSEQWFARPLETSLEIGVPASYNDLFTDQAIRDHVGYVWYQREVHVPRGWDGSRIFVRLDAATHEGLVYVNDHLVAHHVGGYLPFEVDITEQVSAGQSFRLTIAVNNELTQATIPPGTIEVAADGRRQQKYLHDFYNYSGLHRSVWLFSVPDIRVEDVTVVTGFSGSTGSVDYTVDVANVTDGHSVSVALSDATGAVVATAEGAAGTLAIGDVVLWQPGAAYLYTFTAEMRADGELVDTYSLPVGVRTVEVRGHQFLINGEPFHFTGFGMHEGHVTIGKGHSNAAMVNDFQHLGWIDANSFGT